MVNNNLPNLNGTRILVTGGLGFIGSNIALACVQHGAIVTIYDNLDPHSGGNLHNIAEIRDVIRHQMGSISDFETISTAVQNQDIVINCAASTSHPFSMEDPWLNSDVNSRGAINLLEAVKRFNRDARIIHIGTTTQLGPLHYRPADELHPEFPLDVYSANKMVSEKYVLLYANTYDLDAIVLRLPNVYGPRAAIHSPAFTFINYFIGQGLQGMPVPVFSPGHQLRNLLYVGDAVTAILLAMKKDALSVGTYNVCGNQHLSVRDIGQKIGDYFGCGVKLLDWPDGRKSIDVGDAVFSSQKFNCATGWIPVVELEQALPEIETFFRASFDKYLPTQTTER